MATSCPLSYVSGRKSADRALGNVETTRLKIKRFGARGLYTSDNISPKHSNVYRPSAAEISLIIQQLGPVERFVKFWLDKKHSMSADIEHNITGTLNCITPLHSWSNQRFSSAPLYLKSTVLWHQFNCINQRKIFLLACKIFLLAREEALPSRVNKSWFLFVWGRRLMLMCLLVWLAHTLIHLDGL